MPLKCLSTTSIMYKLDKETDTKRNSALNFLNISVFIYNTEFLVCMAKDQLPERINLWHDTSVKW